MDCKRAMAHQVVKVFYQCEIITDTGIYREIIGAIAEDVDFFY